MASVPIAMDVVVYPKGRAGGDQPYPAFVSGVAWRTDVSVGGGPMPPQAPVDPGYGIPIGEHPEHPIVIPPEPPIPPIDELPNPVPPSSVLKESPASGGWGLYSRADSSVYWAYDPPAGGTGPKA